MATQQTIMASYNDGCEHHTGSKFGTCDGCQGQGACDFAIKAFAEWTQRQAELGADAGHIEDCWFRDHSTATLTCVLCLDTVEIPIEEFDGYGYICPECQV